MGYKSCNNSLIKAISKSKKDMCNEIGLLIKNEAQARAPVEGNIRASIDFQVNEDNSGFNIGVTANAPDAIIVEKGSSEQKAQPFLEFAAMNNFKTMEAIAYKNISANMSGD